MTKKITNQSGIVAFSIFTVVVVAIALLSIVYVSINRKYVGRPCGGFAANLPEYQCPIGLRCASSDSYPDAGGQCQYIWPISSIANKAPQYSTSSPNSTTESNKKETEGTKTGEFCGGIANILCPKGYKCKLDGIYPDAGGKCVRL